MLGVPGPFERADSVDVWGEVMRFHGRTASTVAVFVVLAATWAGISPAASAATRATTDRDATSRAAGNRAPGNRVAGRPTLQGNGSVEEAWLTGADPGDRITLMQHHSAVANDANPGTADTLGSLIIRNLDPRRRYYWVDNSTNQSTAGRSPVLAPGQNPPPRSALYTGQPMHQGLNYITMRDGIQLAATVRYPYGGTC